jgi:hypothetical protein
MTKSGAILLGDLPLDHVVTIVCEPCKREGQFRVSTLRQLHDVNTAMPDFLNALTASCPKHQTLGIERCKAIYDPPPADLIR